MKSTRFLKKGITTGTCAAAAAAAASYALLTGEKAAEQSVTLPDGGSVRVDIQNTEIDGETVICSVKKYSGDDPDITDGIIICASVRKIQSGIGIDGGEGIGRVTRAGLDRNVGEAAINSVPRRMIRAAVGEICDECGYTGGVSVIISAPDGAKIAKKTFNPRLGIEGGISILGTSGIVEPMSEKAILDTVFLELKELCASGAQTAVLVPGNYGEEFAHDKLGIERAVQCGNFIGDALDYAADLGFSKILLISHMGKMVKLGSGIMNTHSKYADGRMETLALCAAIAGYKDFKRVLDCVTTDEAYELIRDTKTIDILMDRIDMYLKRRTDIMTGAVMFSNKYGIVGKTAAADEIIRILTQKGEKI